MPIAETEKTTGIAPIKNGLVNGDATINHMIDPAVLSKPNHALWVTQDHKWVSSSDGADGRLYTTEEVFPQCPADSCVVHVVCDSQRSGADIRKQQGSAGLRYTFGRAVGSETAV